MGARSNGYRKEARGGVAHWIVDIRFLDKDGRQKRYRRDALLQTAAGARAEAERLKRQVAARGSLEGAPQVPTFASFVAGDFATLAMVRFKPATRAGYSKILHAREHGLLALIGHKRLDSIDALDARRIEAAALARGAGPRCALVVLRSVLKNAVELGALAAMPRLPRLPEKSAKLLGVPPLAVVVQALGASDGWLRVGVGLAALAGLRAGEVRALEVGDVDLTAGRLFVRRAFSDDVIVTPKGRDERMVPVVPLLASILGAACEGRAPTARVLSDATGAGPSEDALRAAWKRLQGRMGVSPSWHYHQLRHFFATACLRGGANVEAVRMLLGHKDLGSTVRYLHATEHDMVSAVAALPGNSGEMAERPCL